MSLSLARAVTYAGGMRPVLLGVSLAATTLAAAAAACGDDGGMVCDCAAVGCFADFCTKTVFVSSSALPANFGGVAAADMLCAQEAAAAGLEGTYLAWLSDSLTSPRARFSQSTVPYALPDGTQIAPDWNTLLGVGPSTTISQRADKTPVPPDEGTPKQVWTGTSIDGRAETYNNASNWCSNWTRNIIDESAVVGWVYQRIKPEVDWSFSNLVPCTGSGHIYCFQQ